MPLHALEKVSAKSRRTWHAHGRHGRRSPARPIERVSAGGIAPGVGGEIRVRYLSDYNARPTARIRWTPPAWKFRSIDLPLGCRTGREASSWIILFRGELFFHQREARVGVFPCGANPDVLAIFGDGEGAGGTGQKIQIVDIVARAGDYRVIAIVDQDAISIVGFQRLIAGVLAGI